MSPYQSKEFKELQKQWYQKLKENGFEDIENTNSKKEYLSSWSSKYAEPSRRDRIESTRRYFELARQFYNSHSFKDEREKQMWAFHAEGQSLREIAKEVGVTRWRVHMTILSLAPIMLKGIVDD